MRLLSVLLLMWSMIVVVYIYLMVLVLVDNVMLMKVFEVLLLIYFVEVIMLNVMVIDSKGKKVFFGFKLVIKVISEFNWMLLMLKFDIYVVNWIIVGKDGYKV